MCLIVWCLNLLFIKLVITFKIEKMKFTFPLSISSLCAEDAAFTRAEVAAAMDLAASRIISSKFRLSSASYKQQVNRSLFSWTCKWEFNNDHQQESVVMVVQKNTVKYVRLAIMIPKSCKHNETVQKSKYKCYIDYHTLSRQKCYKQYRQFQNVTP